MDDRRLIDDDVWLRLHEVIRSADHWSVARKREMVAAIDAVLISWDAEDENERARADLLTS